MMSPDTLAEVRAMLAPLMKKPDIELVNRAEQLWNKDQDMYDSSADGDLATRIEIHQWACKAFDAHDLIARALALLSPEQAATPPEKGSYDSEGVPHQTGEKSVDDRLWILRDSLATPPAATSMTASEAPMSIPSVILSARSTMSREAIASLIMPPAAKADDLVEAGVKAASALFTELPERTGHLPAGAKVVTPYEFNNIVGQQLNRLLSALDIPRREAEAAAREREAVAAKAREYAGHYAHGSDGRNTFIILAEWIEGRSQPAAKAPEENLEPAVYKRHDKVIVTGEDFEPYEATVLGPYWKLNGKVRYNVEDRGRNFVQRPKQLSPAAKAQGGQP